MSDKWDGDFKAIRGSYSVKEAMRIGYIGAMLDDYLTGDGINPNRAEIYKQKQIEHNKVLIGLIETTSNPFAKPLLTMASQNLDKIIKLIQRVYDEPDLAQVLLKYQNLKLKIDDAIAVNAGRKIQSRGYGDA